MTFFGEYARMKNSFRMKQSSGYPSFYGAAEERIKKKWNVIGACVLSSHRRIGKRVKFLHGRAAVKGRDIQKATG